MEDHFTVLIKLPFNRGDFVDPPPVAWNQSKEKDLWEIISRQPKSNELNWGELAKGFQVTQSFLLQQAAWLYERQLLQVRAQMRKVGSRKSASPSPAIGSVSGSGLGGQPMKRDSSGGSRVPSRLSTQTKEIPPRGEASAPGTPDKAKAPSTIRLGTKSGHSRSRSGSASEQASLRVSRRTSREGPSRLSEALPRISQQPFTHSPKDLPLSSSSSSDDSEDEKGTTSVLQRRTLSTGRHKFQAARKRRPSRPDNDLEEDEDEVSPFLPFAAASTHLQTDMGATLRGSLNSPETHRAGQTKRGTMERIPERSQPTSQSQNQVPAPQGLTSSASSGSSGPVNLPAGPPARVTRNAPQANPRAASLAATGLSPLRRGREGSDESPSMGSSFSDLDETSVTRSAMEEALLSDMQVQGRGRGVGGRMSTIGNALRSRVFENRGS